jgi:hypothetical protein
MAEKEVSLMSEPTVVYEKKDQVAYHHPQPAQGAQRHEQAALAGAGRGISKGG